MKIEQSFHAPVCLTNVISLTMLVLVVVVGGGGKHNLSKQYWQMSVGCVGSLIIPNNNYD